MKGQIYLDHQATTPVDERVLDAMLPYLRGRFGNASSRTHGFGWEAERAVEAARDQAAALVGADPREIVFTSGATESNNLALKGAAEALRDRGDHIVAGPTEHPSVRDTLRWLETRGFRVTWCPVDRGGRLSPETVAEAIEPKTILVTAIAANNEIGTINPVAEIAAVAAERGVWFHTDATQAAGRIPLDFTRDRVALASITAHKIYGPKGCGALYVRRRDPEAKLVPQLHGGTQERGLRAGSLNVPGIVGLGRAADICRAELAEEAERMRRLRDRLQARLMKEIPGLRINGDLEHRIPNNLHVSLPDVEGEAVMLALPHLAMSAGSACSSGSLAPSHVLQAIGLDAAAARGSLRLGVGRFTTDAEVEQATNDIGATYRRLRELQRART